MPYGSLVRLGRSIATTLYGRAGRQLGALLGVDHVVGRRDDVLEAAVLPEVVVQRAQGLDLGHGGAEATRPAVPSRAPTVASD